MVKSMREASLELGVYHSIEKSRGIGMNRKKNLDHKNETLKFLKLFENLHFNLAEVLCEIRIDDSTFVSEFQKFELDQGYKDTKRQELEFFLSGEIDESISAMRIFDTQHDLVQKRKFNNVIFEFSCDQNTSSHIIF